MAIDKTAIANHALQLIGGGRVLNFNTDQGTEADALRDAFDNCFRSLLAMRRWNRFLKRALLAASTTKPAWGFEAQYPLPADCIKVWDVADLTTGEWAVEGDLLLTNTKGSAKILYAANTLNATDPLFERALATLLAYQVGTRLNRKEATNLYRVFEVELAKAARADAIEAPAESIQVGTFYEAALGHL